MIKKQLFLVHFQNSKWLPDFLKKPYRAESYAVFDNLEDAKKEIKNWHTESNPIIWKINIESLEKINDS